MRYVFLAMAVGGSLFGQAIMDATAAAAGGIAGGAAGKKVNDGLNSVLGNVAKQTAQAAGDAKPKATVAVVQAAPAPVTTAPSAGPLIELSPGVPKSGGVPLPPAPPHKIGAEKPAPLPVPLPVVVPEPVAPPPPPPEVTSEDLKNLVAGTNRDDLLKLGAPGSRITMFDDGHLLETFRYFSHSPNGDAAIGVVRLVDGAVSTIELK